MYSNVSTCMLLFVSMWIHQCLECIQLYSSVGPAYRVFVNCCMRSNLHVVECIGLHVSFLHSVSSYLQHNSAYVLDTLNMLKGTCNDTLRGHAFCGCEPMNSTTNCWSCWPCSPCSPGPGRLAHLYRYTRILPVYCDLVYSQQWADQLYHMPTSR